ncbi:hypothetical protein ACMFWY_26615 [Roseiconus sp. JC912]
MSSSSPANRIGDFTTAKDLASTIPSAEAELTEVIERATAAT